MGIKLAEKTHAVFKAFDADRNGHISMKELKTLLQMLDKKQWTNEACDAFVTQLDRNKNGTIEYTELVNYICNDRVCKKDKEAVLNDDIIEQGQKMEDEKKQKEKD